MTRASNQKVRWHCRDCGHEWRARVIDRTRKHPRGCPACAGSVPTATHNLKLTCEESGGRLAHLLVEWNHPTMRPEDFCPSAREIVPWKCGGEACGREWNARIIQRTSSDPPIGCPVCNPGGRPRKPIEL